VDGDEGGIVISETTWIDLDVIDVGGGLEPAARSAGLKAGGYERQRECLGN
jgi:hypothetical protein